jgi:hypothetical protein
MTTTYAESISALSTTALFCRTEAHEWKWVTDYTTTDARKRLIEVERRMECRRCGATARKVIDATTWTVTSRKIDHYPSGYLLKGLGRIDRSEFYREQFTRHDAPAE